MPELTQSPKTKKMRLRDWLKEKLDSKEIAGLEWINRQQGLFKISWRHGSAQGWNVDLDLPIFREWALHTGRYNPMKDKLEPSRWKTNLRCAINALPDITEVKELSCTRGNKARRVYKMRLDGSKHGGKTKKYTVKPGNVQEDSSKVVPTDQEIIELVDKMRRDHLDRRPSPSRRLNTTLPAFEALVVEKAKQTLTWPFFVPFWPLAAWNAIAADLHKEIPEGDGERDLVGENTQIPIEMSVDRSEQTRDG